MEDRNLFLVLAILSVLIIVPASVYAQQNNPNVSASIPFTEPSVTPPAFTDPNMTDIEANHTSGKIKLAMYSTPRNYVNPVGLTLELPEVARVPVRDLPPQANPPEFLNHGGEENSIPLPDHITERAYKFVESERGTNSLVQKFETGDPTEPYYYIGYNAPTRLADTEGFYSAAYYLKETDSIVQVETAEGSFVWDKNTCSLTFYDPQLITDESNPLISSDSFTFMTTTGNSPNWQEMTELNNAVCTTEVFTDEYNVEVRGTKISEDAEAKIRYIKLEGDLLKPQIEITNLNPQWNNQKFGVKQTLHTPETIYFDEPNEVNPQKHNIKAQGLNNAQAHMKTDLKAKGTQVVALGDNIIYDIYEGFDYLKKIDRLYENGVSKVVFDYTDENNGKPGIATGETWILDPLYGTPREKWNKSLYDANNDNHCFDDESYGSVDQGEARYIYKYDTGSASDCYRLAIEWDIGWLPKYAEVKKAGFMFDMDLGYGANPNYIDINVYFPSKMPSQNYSNEVQSSNTVDNIAAVACGRPYPTFVPTSHYDDTWTVVESTNQFDNNNNYVYINGDDHSNETYELIEKRLEDILTEYQAFEIKQIGICVKHTTDSGSQSAPWGEGTTTLHWAQIDNDSRPDFTIMIEYTLPLPTKPEISIVDDGNTHKEVETVVNSTTTRGDIEGYYWKRTNLDAQYTDECHEPFSSGCNLVTRLGFDGMGTGLQDMVIGNLTGQQQSGNGTISIDGLAMEFDFDDATSGIMFHDSFNDGTYVDDWLEVSDPENGQSESSGRLNYSVPHTTTQDMRMATQDRFVSPTGFYSLTWYAQTPSTATGSPMWMYLACGDTTWDDNGIPDNAIGFLNAGDIGNTDGIDVYDQGSLGYSVRINAVSNNWYKINYDDNTNAITAWHWSGAGWTKVGVTSYAELNDDAGGCGIQTHVVDGAGYGGVNPIWFDQVHLTDKDTPFNYAPNILYNQATLENVGAISILKDSFDTYDLPPRNPDIDIDFSEYTDQEDFDDVWVTSDVNKVRGNVTNDNIQFHMTRDNSDDIIVFPIGFELEHDWIATWEMEFTEVTGDPLMWVGFRDDNGHDPYGTGTTTNFVGVHFRGSGATDGTGLCAFSGDTLGECYTDGGATGRDDADVFHVLGNSTTYYFELMAKDGAYELGIYNDPSKTLNDAYGNPYSTSRLENDTPLVEDADFPLLGGTTITGLDNFIIANYPTDAGGGSFRGTLDNLKIWRGTDTYNTPVYEQSAFLLDDFNTYSNSNRPANFTENFSNIGLPFNNWQEVGTLVSINGGLANPALEFESDSDANHGAYLELRPDNLDSWGTNENGDESTLSDHGWLLRFKLDINEWTEADTNDEHLFIGFSDSDVNTLPDTNQDSIGLRMTIDNSGAQSRFYLVSSNNYPAILGTAIEVLRTIPAEGVYYVEIARTHEETAQLCLYLDQNYEDYAYDNRVKECVVLDIDEGITDLDTLKVQTYNAGIASSNVISGIIDDIQIWDNTHTVAIPDDKETPFPNERFNTYSNTTRTADAVWGLNTDQIIEDFTTYPNQTIADTLWKSNDVNKVRANITGDYLDFDFTFDESHDSGSFDLGSVLNDRAWVLRYKMNFSNVTDGSNSTVYMGVFDKDATFDSNVIHNGIGFALKHDSIEQNTDILAIEEYGSAAISDIGGTNTVTVTTSYNHNFTTGQIVHILGTTNFNVEFKPITVTGPTSFTFLDPGHGTPESTGHVIAATMDYWNTNQDIYDKPYNTYDNLYEHGWSQMGTAIDVRNGILDADAVPRGSEHRVYKLLPEELDDEQWQVEFEYRFVSDGATSTACIVCFTSGDETPHHTTWNQDMIGVGHLSQDQFRVIYKDDSNSYVASSASGDTFNDGNWYYGTLKRLDRTTVEASFYTDEARTNHVTGSPISMDIPESIQDLKWIQHSSDWVNGASSTVTFDIDNLVVYNRWDGTENSNIISGTEHGIKTIGSIALIDYDKDEDDLSSYPEQVIKDWAPLINTDYFVEIQRLSDDSFDVTIFSDGNYTRELVKITGDLTGIQHDPKSDIDGLRYFKIFQDDNLGTGKLTGIIDDLQLYDGTHTIAIPKLSKVADAIWGDNSSYIIEDFTTYDNEAESDAKWISDNESRLDVDLALDRLDWIAPTGNVQERIYYDMGLLPDTWALRFELGIDYDKFNGTNTNEIRQFFAVSDDTGEVTTGSQDGVGIRFFKEDLNTSYTSLVYIDEDAWIGPQLIQDFDSKTELNYFTSTGPVNPEIGTKYVQFNKDGTDFWITFFADEYYTTPLATEFTTLPGTIDNLRYFYVGHDGDTNSLASTTGWIDNIELFKDVHDSRMWAGSDQGPHNGSWSSKAESKRFHLDLDREAFYFDLSDNQYESGVAFDMGGLFGSWDTEASDNNWALRFSIDYTVLEQGRTTGWAEGNLHVDRGSAEYCDVTSWDATPRDIDMNPEGTKLIIVGQNGQDINEFTLDNPWDVSSCTFEDVFDLNLGTDPDETDVISISFNTDGTKMFTLGRSLDVFEEWNCATGFDLDTCSDAQSDFNVAGQTTTPSGHEWSRDGTKLWVLGEPQETIYEYDCATFDVSTCVYQSSLSIAAVTGTGPSGFKFNDDYTRFWVSDHNTNDLDQWYCEDDVETRDGSISECVASGESTHDDINDVTRGLWFKGDGGQRLYEMDENENIYEFESNTDPGVGLLIGLSNGDETVSARDDQDFIGFVHEIHTDTNIISLRDTELIDTEDPWTVTGHGLSTFDPFNYQAGGETHYPRADKLYIQVERLTPIRAQLTLFNDASYTTAIASVEQEISLDNEDLTYLKIMNYGDAPEFDNYDVGYEVKGYIDDIQFFNSTARWSVNDPTQSLRNVSMEFYSNTQESRTWAHNWHPLDEDRIYVDLDMDAIYFDAKRDDSQDRLTRHLGQTLDSQHSLRGSLDLTSVVQGADTDTVDLYVGMASDPYNATIAKDFAGFSISVSQNTLLFATEMCDECSLASATSQSFSVVIPTEEKIWWDISIDNDEDDGSQTQNPAWVEVTFYGDANYTTPLEHQKIAMTAQKQYQEDFNDGQGAEQTGGQGGWVDAPYANVISSSALPVGDEFSEDNINDRFLYVDAGNNKDHDQELAFVDLQDAFNLNEVVSQNWVLRFTTQNMEWKYPTTGEVVHNVIGLSDDALSLVDNVNAKSVFFGSQMDSSSFRYCLDVGNEHNEPNCSGGYTGKNYGITEGNNDTTTNSTRAYVQLTSNSTGYYGCIYTDSTYTQLDQTCSIDTPEDLSDPYQSITGLRYLVASGGSEPFTQGNDQYDGRNDQIYDNIQFCNDVETMSPEWNCENGVNGLDTIWIGNLNRANIGADSTLTGYIDDIEIYNKVQDPRDWASENGTNKYKIITDVGTQGSELDFEKVSDVTNWYTYDEVNHYIDLDDEVLRLVINRGDNSKDSMYADPFGEILDTTWTMRAKVTIEDLVVGDASDLITFFGLSDQYNIRNNDAQDAFGIYFFVDSGAQMIEGRAPDNTQPFNGIDFGEINPIVEGNSYWIELIRDENLFVYNVFQDEDYTEQIHGNQYRDNDNGIQNLRYLVVQGYQDTTTPTSKLTVAIDDIEIYNGYSPYSGGAVGYLDGTGNDPEYGYIGIRGEAYYFDGDFDKIVFDSPTFEFHHDQPFTISTWVNAEQIGVEQTFFSTIDSAASWRGVNFRALSDNTLSLTIVYTATTSETRVKTTDCFLTTDEWHHVVATSNPKNNAVPNWQEMEIYMDGKKCTTSADLTALASDPYRGPTSNNPIVGERGYIGAREDDTYEFQGKIDDFMIFNRALTGGEVLAYYNDGNSIDPITGEGTQFSGTIFNENLMVNYELDTLQSSDRNIGISGQNNVLSVTAQEDAVQGFTWNNDGSRLYVIGETGDDVNQYICDTEFLPSSCSFDTATSVSSFTSTPRDIIFNNDGTKAYILGYTEATVSEWSGTAFNFTTFTDSSSDLSISAQETGPQDIQWNDDGTKFFVTGDSGDINEYSCTSYDVSTCTFTDVTDLPDVADSRGMDFNNDGTKLYVGDASQIAIFEYNMTSFDASTLKPTGRNFIMSDTIAIVEDIYYNGQNDLYAMDTTGENIHRFITIPQKNDATLALQNPTPTEDINFGACINNNCSLDWQSTDISNIFIDTSNDVIDFSLTPNNSSDDNQIAHQIVPLGDVWTIRGHINLDANIGNSALINIGVSDLDYLTGMDISQDYIGMQIRQTPTYNGTNYIASMHSDAGVPATSGTKELVLGFGFDYYWEIVRNHEIYYVAMYADSAYTELLAYEVGETANTNQGHNYFKVSNQPNEASLTGTINGTINDVIFYDNFATFGPVADAQSHGVTQVPGGYFNEAFEFDGIDDYIEITPEIFDEMREGTIAFWFKAGTSGDTMCLFCASDSGDASSELRIVLDEANDGKVEFSVREGGVYDYRVETVDSTYDDGEWHHVAVVVDTAKGNKLFIDGLDPEVETTYISGSKTNKEFFDDVLDIDTVSIGKNIYNLGDQWEFNGMIDRFRIYDRALTNDEVKILAEAFFIADGVFHERPLFSFEYDYDDLVGYISGNMDYINSLGIGTQSANPWDIEFSPDGTKMNVLVRDQDQIDYYLCNTPWVVTGGCNYNNQYTYSSTQFVGMDMADDGKVVYYANEGGGSAVNEILAYNCSTPYQGNTCTASNSTSTIVDTYADNIRDVDVVDNGNKMIVLDANDIIEFDLTTPYDVSTASYVQTRALSEFSTGNYALKFDPTGHQLTVIEDPNDYVGQYYCTTPWSIESCYYASGELFDQTTWETTPVGFTWKDDGTKMYVVGHAGDAVDYFETFYIENVAELSEYNYTYTFQDTFVTDNWIDADDSNPTSIKVNTDPQVQKLEFDIKHDNTNDASVVDVGVLSENWIIDFDFNVTALSNSDAVNNAMYVVVSDHPGASSVLQDALGFRLQLISGSTNLEIGDVDGVSLASIADLSSTFTPQVKDTVYMRMSELNVVDTTPTDNNLFTLDIYADPERTILMHTETWVHPNTVDDLQYFKVLNIDDQTGSTNILRGTIDNLTIYDGISLGGSTTRGAWILDDNDYLQFGTTGIRDQTMYFDGSKYIDMTNGHTATAELLGKALQYDHSFCTWWMPTYFEDGTQYIFSAVDAGNNDDIRMYMTLQDSTRNLYVTFDDGVDDPTIGITIQELEDYNSMDSDFFGESVWHHLCYVYDENNTADALKLFLNGKLIGSDTGNFDETGAFGDPIQITIGKRAWTTAEYIYGYLDDTNFFTTALTDSEVDQLYNMGNSIDTVKSNIGEEYIPSYFVLGAGNLVFEEKTKNPNAIWTEDFGDHCTENEEPNCWYYGYAAGNNFGWDTDGEDAWTMDFIHGSGSTNSDRALSLDLGESIALYKAGQNATIAGTNHDNLYSLGEFHSDFRLRYTVYYDNIVSGGWDQHWVTLNECYQGRQTCRSTETTRAIGVFMYPGSGNYFYTQDTYDTTLQGGNRYVMRDGSDGGIVAGVNYYVDLWTEANRGIICASISSTDAYDGDMSKNPGGTCNPLHANWQLHSLGNDGDRGDLRYLKFDGRYGTTSTGTVDGHYDDIEFWYGDIGIPSPVGGNLQFDMDTYFYSPPDQESRYDFERTDAFSTAFWMRSLNDDQAIFGKHQTSGDHRGWGAHLEGAGYLEFQLHGDDGTGNSIVVRTDATYDDGKWHHVVMAYDGSSLGSGVTIYVDGVQVPVTIDENNLTSSILNDEPLRIGMQWSTDYFQGGLDDFRVYNIELSPAQVDDLFNYRLNDHNLLDTFVVPDTDYEYQAAGVNQNGYGEFSDGVVPTGPVFTVPGAPTNMNATTINSDRIDLSWTAPGYDGGVPITGYKIERESPVGGGWNTLVADTGSTSTTYSNTILLGGTQYNYRVSAINSIGVGTASGTDSDWTDFDPPVGLTATPIDDDTIQLTWSAPAGGTPTGYTIERESPVGGATESWNVIVDTYTGGVSYDNDGVTLGQTYNYRAYSTGGIPANSTYSNEDDAATLIGADPPSNVSAVVNDVDLDPLRITLSWTPPTNLGANTQITGYEIHRNINGGAFSQWIADTGNVTTYDDTTVSPNTTYSYKIKTLGDVIPGALGNATTPLLTANYTSIPFNFTSAILDPIGAPYNVTLNWSAPLNDGGSALQYYTVYRSEDDISYTNHTSTTLTTIVITEPAVANKTYYYKVSALNGVGWSANATTLISVASNPSAPLNVNPTVPQPDTLPWEINVAWDAPTTDGGSPVVEYTIWRSTTFNGTYTNVTAVNGTTLSFLDTTVPAPSPANQTYWYKVQAKNLLAYGPNSTAAVIYTIDVPGAPTMGTLNIPVPYPEPWQINATWNYPVYDGRSSVTGYTLWRATDLLGPWVNVTSVNGNTTDFLDTTVPEPSPADEVYYYKVQAKNYLDVWGANSTAISIITPGVPDPPTNVDVTIPDAATEPYELLVTWDAPADNGGTAVTGYTIYRSTNDVVFVNITAVGNVTQYLDTVPSIPSQIYYYRVAATNLVGTGANSTSANLTTGSAPSAPLNFSVTPRADHTSFYLDWDTPASDGGSPITGYQIQVNVDDAGWTTLVANTGTTDTDYIDTGRSVQTNYKYAVYAISIVGGGAGSTVEQGEFTHAVLTPTVTPLTGNAIQFDIDVNMTYGIPDTEIYDVELRLWRDYPHNSIVTQISPAPSDFVAKGSGVSYTLWDNIQETEEYYISVKTRNGVTGEFYEWRTAKLTATPSLIFDDSLLGVEYRNSNFTQSNLQIVGSPANYDLVVVYREQNNLDNVIVLTWENVLTDVVEVTDVDPTKRYYISGYYAPTFNYTIGASPINGTATIPTGYPVDISLISVADPNQVGFTMGIDTIAGESGIFGLPLVFIFIIALAAIFTGRSAPMGIIFIAVAIGMMAYMGLIDFNFDPANSSNTAVWAIIIVAVIIGVMVGKRWD